MNNKDIRNLLLEKIETWEINQALNDEITKGSILKVDPIVGICNSTDCIYQGDWHNVADIDEHYYVSCIHCEETNPYDSDTSSKSGSYCSNCYHCECINDICIELFEEKRKNIIKFVKCNHVLHRICQLANNYHNPTSCEICDYRSHKK